MSEAFQALRKTNLVLNDDDQTYQVFFGLMDELVFLNSARIAETEDRTAEDVIGELIQKYAQLHRAAKEYQKKQLEKMQKELQEKPLREQAAREKAAREKAAWEQAERDKIKIEKQNQFVLEKQGVAVQPQKVQPKAIGVRHIKPKKVTVHPLEVNVQPQKPPRRIVPKAQYSIAPQGNVEVTKPENADAVVPEKIRVAGQDGLTISKQEGFRASSRQHKEFSAVRQESFHTIKPSKSVKNSGLQMANAEALRLEKSPNHTGPNAQQIAKAQNYRADKQEGIEVLKKEAPPTKASLAESTRVQQVLRSHKVADQALKQMRELRKGALIYFETLDPKKKTDMTWGGFWKDFAEHGTNMFEQGVTLPPVAAGGIRGLMDAKAALAMTKDKFHFDSEGIQMLEQRLDDTLQLLHSPVPNQEKVAQNSLGKLLNGMDQLKVSCRRYLKWDAVATKRGNARQKIVHQLFLGLGLLDLRINTIRSAITEGIAFKSAAGVLDKETWETMILYAEKEFHPARVMNAQGTVKNQDRTALLLEMLEAGMQNGLGFNADVYRNTINALRNVQIYRKKQFTGNLHNDIQLIKNMEQYYTSIKQNCRQYTSELNGVGKNEEHRKVLMFQLLENAEEDSELLQSAHQMVLNSDAEGQQLTWEDVFAKRKTKNQDLAMWQNEDKKGDEQEEEWEWEADNSIPAGTALTAEAYIENAKIRCINKMKADEKYKDLAALLEKWNAKEMKNEKGDGVAFVEQHLAGAVLEAKQKEMLVARFNEIKNTGLQEYAVRARFYSRANGAETLNTTRRKVATYRVARLLGIEKLVAASHAVVKKPKDDGGVPGVVTQVVKDDFAPKKKVPKAEAAQERNAQEQNAQGQNAQGQNALANGNVGGMQPIEISSNIKRQAVCLQMFDALCGLPMRRLEEFTLKGNPADEKSSVMATGNDYAFGTDAEDAAMRKLFLYQLNANDEKKQKLKKDTEKIAVVTGLSMQYYDRELAENIVQLSEEDVIFALEGMITQNEIEAFLKRLDLMKRNLQRFMNDPLYAERFLQKGDWPNASEDRLNSVLYYTKVKTKLANAK